MTQAELRKLGEKVYGPGWQSKLARAIPVNSRTVRRWVSGKSKVPAAVALLLREKAKMSSGIEDR